MRRSAAKRIGDVRIDRRAESGTFEVRRQFDLIPCGIMETGSFEAVDPAIRRRRPVQLPAAVECEAPVIDIIEEFSGGKFRPLRRPGGGAGRKFMNPEHGGIFQQFSQLVHDFSG